MGLPNSQAAFYISQDCSYIPFFFHPLGAYVNIKAVTKIKIHANQPS